MIVLIRFVFSWPGLLAIGTTWFVSQHPVGSAELVTSVLQGLWAFIETTLELLGVDMDTQPTQ